MDTNQNNHLDHLAELARNAGYAVKHDRRKAKSAVEILSPSFEKHSKGTRLGRWFAGLKI
jgi:hypothetical protein